MKIAENLNSLKAKLPKKVTLVAVSKTKPPEDIMVAYHAGQRIFGENKAQEMLAKHQVLPKDIRWHMIGHLQRNKVKYIAPFVSLIHSVDSLKLLTEINKQAQKQERIIDCLLQVRIAEETTKFGLNEKDLFILLHSNELKAMKNIQVKGLMGMASFSNTPPKIEKEFSYLAALFKKVTDIETYPWLSPTILSMGMSGDYPLAISCGSNMIRVGSQIFGSRI